MIPHCDQIPVLELPDDLQSCLIAASAQFLCNGFCQASMYVFAPGRDPLIENVAMFMENHTDGKDMLERVLVHAASMPDVTAVALLTECWAVKLEKDEDPAGAMLLAYAGQLHKSPKRAEQLNVTFETRGDEFSPPEHYLCILPIIREPGQKAKLGKPECARMPSSELISMDHGRFQGLFLKAKKPKNKSWMC